MSDVEHLVSSLGEEQRRAPDEAALRRALALARRLQLAHGRGVELQERGDHLVYSSASTVRMRRVCALCVRALCVQQPLECDHHFLANILYTLRAYIAIAQHMCMA